MHSDLTPTPEECQAALKHHGSQRKAAAALGVTRALLVRRLNRLDPAIRASMDAAGTAMVPHLAWVKTKGGDGADYSILLKPEAEESSIEQIREAFEGLPAAITIPPPEEETNPIFKTGDLINLIPIADAHIGMMAWGRETGADYSTQIAHDRIINWTNRVATAAPRAGTAIILVAGDLIHADNSDNVTPKSRHALDVDTRHFKTIDATIRAITAAVEIAASLNDRVIVRVIPGNHDPTSYLAVVFALAERYRDNHRITVDKEPGEFAVWHFGKVMIAAHHGDKAKPDGIVLGLADTHYEIWGKTRYRYLFTGHLHHHKSADIGGVVWEQLRPVANRDSYAVSHSFVARPELQCITYNANVGEVSRVRVSI